MGGRPAPAAGPLRGEPPRQLRMRERLGALRNVPPFLRLIWQTSRILTAGTLTLRFLRALLPVATLYIGKVIIDVGILRAQLPGSAAPLGGWIGSGLLGRLGWLLGIELMLAIFSDVLARVVSLLDSLLAEQFTNETSIRLMEHA